MTTQRYTPGSGGLVPVVKFDGQTFDLVGGVYLVAGRDPGDDGLRIDDRAVSASAARFRYADGSIEIKNLSTRATLLVSGDHGPRNLEPDEVLWTESSCEVLITGHQRHHLELAGLPRRVPREGLATWRFVDQARPMSELRRDVLVAACLAHFEPFNYPRGRLTYREISVELRSAGVQISYKGVDNHLVGIFNQLNEDGAPDLADLVHAVDFVTREGLVTNADVRRLRARQAIRGDNGARE